MLKCKMIVFAMTLTLGVSGCMSAPRVQPPAVECPKPAPPPAWVMEPAPNLIPLLDRIISPSVRGSKN